MQSIHFQLIVITFILRMVLISLLRFVDIFKAMFLIFSGTSKFEFSVSKSPQRKLLSRLGALGPYVVEISENH